MNSVRNFETQLSTRAARYRKVEEWMDVVLKSELILTVLIPIWGTSKKLPEGGLGPFLMLIPVTLISMMMAGDKARFYERFYNLARARGVIPRHGEVLRPYRIQALSLQTKYVSLINEDGNLLLMTPHQFVRNWRASEGVVIQ